MPVLALLRDRCKTVSRTFSMRSLDLDEAWGARQCVEWLGCRTFNQEVLGFKSFSDQYLELFFGIPKLKSSATLVNSQLVCLLPAGILKI